MKPYVLYGHDRPLTWVQYSKEGDLLFTCAKDSKPMLWRVSTGERIGVYEGHTGSVWHLDVCYKTKLLLTGAADNSAKLWDVQTGKMLHTWPQSTPVRVVSFSLGAKMFLCVTDKLMGYDAFIKIYKVDANNQERHKEPIKTLTGGLHKNKVTMARFASMNKTIITAGDDGWLKEWDWQSGDCIREVQVHSKGIKSFQLDKTEKWIITASQDSTAKLIDVATFEVIKTFITTSNVNAACLSPVEHHVIIGGGQEAMDVTTTTNRVGKFEARIFETIHASEIGTVKGHFGPLNALAFCPLGNGYTSGGEDGTVRIHHFDGSYDKLRVNKKLDGCF